MSFAKDVKKELTQIICTDVSEFLAMLSAFLHLNAKINKEKDEIVFETTNPSVAILFYKTMKKLYPATLSVSKNYESNLFNQNQISIKITSELTKIIKEHGLDTNSHENREKLIPDDKTKKAYLRGAFLSRGSINDPKTSEYHLEISTLDIDLALFIQKIINYYELDAKITKRRNDFVVYLKNAEKIFDFLVLVDAKESYFKYEETRIQRDFLNSVNRICNMDIANENKAVKAGQQQLKEINYILEKKYNLSDKLKEIVNLRKENPVSSLHELTSLYYLKYNKAISKSGLYHRFNKIKQIYNELKILNKDNNT